jgi:hypothetical protein
MMFVQIHTLRDYSTALPNRGQDGLAKRTVYGGIERQRISSQSFKAALRDDPSLIRTGADGRLAQDTLAALAKRLGLAMSVRSALIGERKVAPALKAAQFSDEEAEAWAKAIMGLWQAEDAADRKDAPLVVGDKEIAALVQSAVALKKAGSAPGELRALFEKQRQPAAKAPALIIERKVVPALKKAQFSDEEADTWTKAIMSLWQAEDANDRKDAPLVLGEKEIAALVAGVVALKSAGSAPSELRALFDKLRQLAMAQKEAQAAVTSMRALKSHSGIDGALFGRFATGVAVNNVDSAVHVAHLVTVHPLYSVTDFFSVQDLLKTGDGEDRGGSHINTAELTSGLFYGYLVIDVRQLDQNFAELTPEQRAEIIAWLIRAVAQVEPAAKLGSTAPYHGLRELMVEIGPRQPRTLIGAFELPVEGASNKALSETARIVLMAHAKETDALIGAPAWRSEMRSHAGGAKPAVERLADTAASKLIELMPQGAS